LIKKRESRIFFPLAHPRFLPPDTRLTEKFSSLKTQRGGLEKLCTKEGNKSVADMVSVSAPKTTGMKQKAPSGKGY
jgi:hypothetical protein